MAWHGSEVKAESMKLSIPLHIAQVLYPAGIIGDFIFACCQLHILISAFVTIGSLRNHRTATLENHKHQQGDWRYTSLTTRSVHLISRDYSLRVQYHSQWTNEYPSNYPLAGVVQRAYPYLVAAEVLYLAVLPFLDCRNKCERASARVHLYQLTSIPFSPNKRRII